MPEVRPIDANALRNKICAACAERLDCTDYGDICFEVACIDNAPTIEPEVLHGRWVMNNPYGIKCCSECGYGQIIGAENYCPNCGAKMDLRTPTEVQLDEAEPKLRNCPFCGARALVVGYRKVSYVDGHWMPEHLESYSVVAEHYATCVLRDMTSGIRFSTEKEAAEAWNRRADNG